MTSAKDIVNKYQDIMKKYLDKKHTEVCPHCGHKEVDVDTWGLFPPDLDVYFYCLKCDDVWRMRE